VAVAVAAQLLLQVLAVLRPIVRCQQQYQLFHHRNKRERMKNHITQIKAFIALLCFGLCSLGSVAAPSTSSALFTDVQSEYNKDETYDTFQFAAMVSCFIRSMAPDQMVGKGAYLAYIDETKCNDSTSSGSSSSSGGSVASVPKYSMGIATSTVDSSTNKMTVVVRFKASNDDDGVTKHIHVKAVITSGPGVTPPYGVWDMDYCESSVGSEGTCDKGKGFVRVNASSVDVHQKSFAGEQGSRAGSAVFDSTTSGYGVMTQTGSSNGIPQTLNTNFSYAPAVYLRQTKLNGAVTAISCLNPKITDPETLFNIWETYLYDTNGNKVTYTNQGFQIHSTQSGANYGRTIGYANYWGVNWWNDATAADKTTNAVVAGAVNNVQKNFVVKAVPGRLEKITTSAVTMAAIDQVVFKMGFWGAEKNIIDTAIHPTTMTSDTNHWYSFLGYWDNTNSKFKLSGIQSCDSSNCSLVSIDTANSTATKTEFTLTELIALGANGFGGWIDGSGINYSAGITQWSGSSNVAKADIIITKESRKNIQPNDLDEGKVLFCVNNCYDSSKNQFNISWPYKQNDVTNYTWSQSAGAPVIGGVAMDFSSTKSGHWMRLYDVADKPSMDCQYWENGVNHATGGLCDWNFTQNNGVTYYNWNSGNAWDAYSYLVYQDTGLPYQFDPPITLTYNVPAAASLPIGVDKGYANKKIQIQSPGPGELWLPGHCINKTTYAKVDCGDSNIESDWMQDFYINFDASNVAASQVTLNDPTTGAETQTKYYAKWLKRGILFALKPASYCSSLNLNKTTSMSTPSLSNWNNPATGNVWGVTDADFNATPKVIHGVLQ